VENKVYISAPMSIPWGDVLETKARLESHFSNVTVWDRDYGNYRSWDFGNANIVVFMLPLNKFAYTKNLLPTGVNKELSEAIVNGKQMYIAYKLADGKLSIYESRVNGGVFEAISGTSGNIFEEHSKHRVPTIDEKLKSAAEQIAINSRYGIHTQNPCEEIGLPLYHGKKKYEFIVKYYDERLLLMM